MRKLVLLIFTCLILANSEVLFTDNFDNGWSNWQVNGPSVVSTTLHVISGEAVRIRDNTILTKSIDTTGHSGISVHYSLAAGVLENPDHCYFEVSFDGNNWITVLDLGNGQDNNVYQVGTYQNVAADDNPNFAIRYRVQGSGADNCYLEDTEVSTSSGPSGGRSILTYDEIMSCTDLGHTVDTYGYKPIDELPATNTFEGTLVIIPAVGFFDVIVDTYGDLNVAGNEIMPKFTIVFVQDGDNLIPEDPGRTETIHNRWEYIVGPGKVWDEASDNGYTRGSFPFTLVEKNSNCVHNGIMTFLFQDTGFVSCIFYQIASETCMYAKADFWGTSPATYLDGTVANKATIVSDFNTEVSDRFETKDISELATDYPGTNPNTFASEISSTHLTSHGVVVGNVHYVGVANTRRGPIPYPDSMVHPYYSTAKSSFASLALMRSEKKYPGAFDMKANDGGPSALVPECSNTNWDLVTLRDLTNMCTGRYRSLIYMRDEANSDTNSYSWFLEETHAGRIDYACTRYNYKKLPGVKWVYHTTDSYILATALEAYIQANEGKTLYEFVNDEVYGPNKQSKMMMTSGHFTYDSVKNPFGGYGMFYTRDDIAKFSDIFHNDGKIDNSQVLDQSRVKAALQKDPSDTGIEIQSMNDPWMYNYAFWAKEHAYDGCPNQYIPVMSGFGGITVAILPNGVTYHYTSDNDEFGWIGSTQETSNIAPLC